MDGKVAVSEEKRHLRHLRGVERKIGRYQRKQDKGKGSFGFEIAVLSVQAKTLKQKLGQARQ